MTFDDEFKQALQLLPAKEKDKLILRLLKLNIPLANKLRFELVDTDTVQDKRLTMEQFVTKRMQWITMQGDTSGGLLLWVRDLSGRINEHVAMTRDKVGEISLNCMMIRLLLEQNNSRIASFGVGRAHSLLIYIVARMFKLLVLISKQHEDLHLEFREDVEAIGRLMGKNPNLMKVAINNGLDINWLTRFEIPENIAEIQKRLRANGFLR